jgi:hypothetical protein
MFGKWAALQIYTGLAPGPHELAVYQISCFCSCYPLNLFYDRLWPKPFLSMPILTADQAQFETMIPVLASLQIMPLAIGT